MAAFDKVDPQLDFPKEEKEVLRFWKERQVFHKSLELRRGKEPFVFFEGPPTANGLPHNGHVLTRVIKDLFPRYQTMRGKFVGRKAGWDTHGLPVEVEVEKELRIHGKAAIEQYGVEPFIARCIDSVFRYTKEWEELTERIGFWVDLDKAYVTYHRSYVESVWWALSQLFEKGLLYQGHKVVWWWAQGGTALSAAEVGQGYKPVDDPSVYVAFPLEGSDESLLVWTTTPWTLPSNSYAAVHPGFEYVLVEAGARKLWIAKGLRDALAKKLGAELHVLAEKKGSELVGRRYTPPFDLYRAQAAHYFRVIAAEFVTLDTGSGIVHIAPAFGEDDFEAHKKELAKLADPSSVPLLCAVKPDGTFAPELARYAGRWVKECDKEIVRELEGRGVLVHHETYRHDYPFCLRADQDPLIQFARPAWYIRTTQEIARAIENNQSVRWLPEHIKEGRMGDFLRNNVDWALSRERWWGTPLNIWVCDKDPEHKEAPSSVAAILAKNPKAFDHFHEAKKKDPSLNDHLLVHKPWVDQVTFGCSKCGGTMRRVSEVIDCWFDSGCMPFAQWGFPHADGSADRLRESFPADFISEAIDQTRGWFYSLLMISTLVFDGPMCAKYTLPPALPHPFETCIVLGHVCDKEGKKESKSKGNYTPPDIVFDQVKLEFAAFAKDTHAKVKLADAPAGKVWMAPEDHEGMDLPAKATGMILRAHSGKSITVEVETKKGLPRRALVLSDADMAALGVRATKKADVKPSEVGWLPKDERVVLEDPSQPAPGADAFRWFFYASSPPWSNTRHSLSNVRTLQKDFLVKLRNTWSFFTIYANIDGFDPARPKGDAPRPSELDRWILSELHATVRGVTKDLDGYLVYEATQRLSSLVESLSNWWVRRSRERFWRSGWDADKRAAHETLYECLVTIAKLSAPFVPFMADAMYQSLTKPLGTSAPESVHLCDWPAADAAKIDEALSEKMAAVRDVVSLGLQVRTAAKLKVRQPLRAAHLVVAKASARAGLEEEAAMIKDELNVLELHFASGERAGELATPVLKPNFRTLGQRGLGKEAQLLKKALSELAPEAAIALHADIIAGRGAYTVEGRAVELQPQDVEVAYTTKPGFAAAGDRVGVIALETELDDELRELGVLRELTNRVQTARKDERLEFTDRIALGVVGGERVARVVAKFGAELSREVLATALTTAPVEGAVAREVDVEGEKVVLYVARAAR